MNACVAPAARLLDAGVSTNCDAAAALTVVVQAVELIFTGGVDENVAITVCGPAVWNVMLKVAMPLIKLAVFGKREAGEPAGLDQWDERELPAPSVRTVVAAVDRVTSIVDYLKVMNRAFLGLGREGLVIPENREQVAQLLLLNSDDRVREFLDSERKWVRIVARSHEHQTYDLQQMFEKLDVYLAAEFPGARRATTRRSLARRWSSR